MNTNILPLYDSSDKLVVMSEDCYQFDSEGKRYIDFESGVWCTNIGHSNERVIKLIEKQIRESIHHGYKFRNSYSEDLSRELQRIIGYQTGASVFLSSGSEAINLSISISKHLSNRNKILRIDNTYLSAYGFGQISAHNDSLVNISFDDINSISEINFSDISALVLEVGCASMGIVQFPDYYFVKHLYEESKKNNCLVIADEVTTGIGRLGEWFGFQRYDILPDLVVTGKALGNGYPISAVTVDSEIAKKLDQNKLRYAQSHQNDPLGCAVGLEVIKVIEENNLIEKCKSTGDYFKTQLEAIMKRYPDKAKEVRGSGLMLALEFKEDVNGEKINDKLFANGFVVGCRKNTLRFLPPFTIKKSDIDELITGLDEILKSC